MADPAYVRRGLSNAEHTDPGLRADPSKPNLLANATTRVLNPYIGTEVLGVQVSQLVVFRDQDFKDLSPERQIAIAEHFGPIQRHPTSGNVKSFPEFHVGEWFLIAHHDVKES
jgi:sulfonate dioxygenase